MKKQRLKTRVGQERHSLDAARRRSELERLQYHGWTRTDTGNVQRVKYDYISPDGMKVSSLKHAMKAISP